MPETAELLDLLAALRGRRAVTAADLERADTILATAVRCTTCGELIEVDNEDEWECFSCQGAPEL